MLKTKTMSNYVNLNVCTQNTSNFKLRGPEKDSIQEITFILVKLTFHCPDLVHVFLLHKYNYNTGKITENLYLFIIFENSLAPKMGGGILRIIFRSKAVSYIILSIISNSIFYYNQCFFNSTVVYNPGKNE